MLHQSVKASDVIAILRRRWILIVVLSVTGGAAAFLASRILPKRFTSQTLVLVQQPTVSPQLVPTLVSDNSNQQLAAMQQEILSRARLEPVIQELNLYPNDVGQVSMEELVERLRRSITITPIQAMAETRAQNLPGFTISVVFPEPHFAQQICAKITSMFLAKNIEQRQGASRANHPIFGKPGRRGKGQA